MKNQRSNQERQNNPVSRSSSIPVTQPINPLTWFELWLLYRSQAADNPLTPEAAEPYRYIWSSWCQWLLSECPEGENWQEVVLQAQPTQALSFLSEKVKPVTQRNGKNPEISSMTRERYCMVLREVYGHLHRLGYLTDNPMLRLYQIAGDDRPDGEILDEEVWEHVLQVHRLSGRDPSPFVVRDRALLALMFDIALTPGELAALGLHQVVFDAGGDFPVRLQIEGSRPAQRRQLELSAETSAALQDWLTIRDAALQQTTQDTLSISNLVFFTERRRPLSRRVLFHLTSHTIMNSCQVLGLPLPRHLGALVLRNTVVLHWLRSGMAVEEVCRRAGYQNRLAFEHLRVYLVSE